MLESLIELKVAHDEPAVLVALTGEVPVYTTDVLRDAIFRLASEVQDLHFRLGPVAAAGEIMGNRKRQVDLILLALTLS